LTKLSLILGMTLALAVLMPIMTSASSLGEAKKLTDPNATFDANFGVAVALEGDRAIVGAHFESHVAFQDGTAYIFERNAGGASQWGAVGRLFASDAKAFDNFGASVALSGDTAIAGAPAADGHPGAQAGAAYIFERNHGGTGAWGQVVKLRDPTTGAFDHFGFRVAVIGDLAFVAAPGDDVLGLRTGAVYLFGRNQGGTGSWGLVKELTASDGTADDAFGDAIALTSDTAVVGADRKGGLSGAAYVFERDAGGLNNWGQVNKITALDAHSGDFFGSTLGLSAATLVVGAIGKDLGRGAAYVFERNEGGPDNWGEVRELTAAEGQASDAFGGAVALSGDMALVGSLNESSHGLQAGAAYVFDRNTGGTEHWGPVAKLTASDAQPLAYFGISVAINGGTALIGAIGVNAGAVEAGAVYVFDASSKPTPTPTLTPTPTPPAVGGISFDAGVSRGTRPRSSLQFWVLTLASGGAAGLGGLMWSARRKRL
jgi:hypothetical protein